MYYILLIEHTMKKTHGNHMWFTCVAHVVTCDPHVTTCESHVIHMQIYFFILNLICFPCGSHVTTCNQHVVTCDSHVDFCCLF